MPTMIRRILAQLSTLRWRLTLFYCLLLAILLAAFSLFVYSRFQDAQKQNTIARLADMALVFQPTGVPDDQLKQAFASGKFGSPNDALQKLLAEQMVESSRTSRDQATRAAWTVCMWPCSTARATPSLPTSRIPPIRRL